MQKDNLKQKFDKEIKKELGKKLGIKNSMAVPSLKKIVINAGTGEIAKNKESWAKFVEDLGRISGQKPKVTKARLSVAGFGVREGQSVGLTITLRGEKMYSFYSKLTSIILPRLRDFRGVPKKSFDKNGNYTLGLTEHTVFPEIDFSKVDRPHGLEITIVTNAGSQERGMALLEIMGMPFEKDEERKGSRNK